MKKLNYLLLLGAILAFGTFSCGDDDEEPVIENEEELITTVIYTLTNGAETAEFRWQDLDGDGAMEPVITNATLSVNTDYTGSLRFLNESASPAEEITEEIEEEDLEHQVFFESDVISVAYRDTDPDGNPLGLASLFRTRDAGAGELTITLRHEPDKTATGVSEGDILNAGGETDIAVTFSVVVQ